jgi:hypothetical protein
MRLAENLKPVADPPDKSTSVGELNDGLHQGRKPSHRTRPKIIAIREAARQDDAVRALKIAILVPQHDSLLTRKFDRVRAIPIRPSTGENGDPEPHCYARPPIRGAVNPTPR